MDLLKKIWKFTKVSHILFFLIVGFFIYMGSRGDVIDYFSQIIQNDMIGVASFILLFTLVTVIAPLTALPLVIPASAIFGPFLVSVYSILGWTLGAMIAFLIARHMGKPFLKSFLPLKKIENYEKYLSGNVEFWALVLLRVIMPVDLLSYAVGILTRISFRKYMLATIIGITPFAFAFAYIGDAFVQGKYMMFAVYASVGVLLFGFIYLIYRIYRVGGGINKHEDTKYD